MKTIERESRVGELAAKDYRKTTVFKKYGIDYCCGGRLTVKEACRKKGLNPELIIQELDDSSMPKFEHENYLNTLSPSLLARYLTKTHHRYAQEATDDLTRYAQRSVITADDKNRDIRTIANTIYRMSDAVNENIFTKQKELFPAIYRAEKDPKTGKELHDFFKKLITRARREHREILKTVNELEMLSDRLVSAEETNILLKLLYFKIETFRDDLLKYFHIEHNILFPKVLAI